MKKFLILVAFLFGISQYGQVSILKSSIDSGGNIAQNGTVKMVYTIGEVVVKENTNGTLHISEGFIDPETLKPLGLENYSILKGVYVYPNPTSDFLKINFENESHYKISIYDIQGKQTQEYQLSNLENTINLESLSSGNYVLLIVDTQNQLFTNYKLLKQ